MYVNKILKKKPVRMVIVIIFHSMVKMIVMVHGCLEFFRKDEQFL